MQITIRTIKWAHETYPIECFDIRHVDNCSPKNLQQRGLYKQAGMSRGWPDIFLPWRTATYGGLFIELKNAPNKYPTKPQREFLIRQNRNGYCACVAKSLEDAKNVITLYLTHSKHIEKYRTYK